MSLVFWMSLIFPICLAIAIYTDIRRFKIPNILCFVLALSFLPTAILADFSMLQIAWRYGIGLLMLLIGLMLFAMKLFGGGDGKLLAAASIWTGHELLPGFLFYVAIFGGLLGLIIFLLRKLRLFDKLSSDSVMTKFMDPKNGIPYAVAIGAGGFCIYPWLPGLSLF